MCNKISWGLKKEKQQKTWCVGLTPDQEFPVGLGLSQCVFQESLQVFQTPSTVWTLAIPQLFCFFYSLRNWKRGWLSYLPIFSEQLISGRAKARVGSYSLSHCGVFPPFLLPCETLQKKKKKKGSDNQSAQCCTLSKAHVPGIPWP